MTEDQVLELATAKNKGMAKTMRKLNKREESIKRGYLDCLNGKKPALALRENGRWTPTKSPRKCSLIWFNTDDGGSYKASPAYIEEKFLTITEESKIRKEFKS